jgi:sortase A
MKKALISLGTGLLVIAVSIVFQTAGKIHADAAPAGIPVRLRAPEIDLDVTIEQTGFAADGTSLGVPKSCYDVAWYKFGPRPGTVGNAVIDGHVECKTVQYAALYNLDKILVGETFQVTDDQGVTRTFEVTKKTSYAYNQVDTSLVFSNTDGDADLNIITCGGTWMPDKKLYDQRLVVFAKLLK